MATKTRREPTRQIVEEKSEIQLLNERIMFGLSELGGQRAAADEIEYGRGFRVPTEYQGRLPDAAKRLIEIHEELEAQQEFVKTYPFKIWDVSAAVARVFQTVFGVSVVQKSTFFKPAGFREVPISVTDTITVPTGNIAMPTFQGILSLTSIRDDQGHPITHMSIYCPKKHQNAVTGFWMLVEQELFERSIYKGKAIDSSDMPRFLDLRQIDRDKIIYNRATLHQLQANLWNPIQYPTICRQQGISAKRAILLQGKFGTGKTLGAMWTAKCCEEQERTFIMCNPKDNNVFECLMLAAQYQPACLFIEDIDALASTDDRDAMSRLLDEFDGLRVKGLDLIIVMTTNHVGDIAKGMLRPGRLDAIIEIANLDREGTTKLIKSVFREDQLDPDLDYDVIHEKMEDFTPAFVKEVCQKVHLYSIERIATGESTVYNTDDFVAACEEMRVHYNLHMEGKDRVPPPTMDAGLKRMLENVVDKLPIVDAGDDPDEARFEIRVPSTDPR